MRLMRTSDIAQRPVVTVAGEDVAQIKDIVYAADGGSVSGFTLAGRGLFAGPLKEGLSWKSVAALGADAVMIADEAALEPTDSVLGRSRGGEGSHGNVLGSQVLTEDGVALGTVHDVVVAVDSSQDGQCDVVGYEIVASDQMGTQGDKVLIPLPDTMAASGEHLMVPTSVRDFVGHDLAGFGAAVERFREHLGGAQ
ncbi:MAG: PRC-barrel domain-containing protein [Nocardioidaceae bacterium]